MSEIKLSHRIKNLMEIFRNQHGDTIYFGKAEIYEFSRDGIDITRKQLKECFKELIDEGYILSTKEELFEYKDKWTPNERLIKVVLSPNEDTSDEHTEC